MNSIFIRAGVAKDGPEEVDYLILRTSLMYYSSLMGEVFPRRAPVKDLRFWRSLLVCMLVDK